MRKEIYEVYLTKNNQGGKGEYLGSVTEYKDIKSFFNENINMLYVYMVNAGVANICYKDEF